MTPTLTTKIPSIGQLAAAIRNATANAVFLVDRFPYADRSAANTSETHLIVVPTVDSVVGPVGKLYIAASSACEHAMASMAPAEFAQWIASNHVGSSANWREIDVMDFLRLLHQNASH